MALGVIDRYFGAPLSKRAIVGKIISSVGSRASLVAISGVSHTLIDCYKEYLGSAYMKTLGDIPTFDARLFKHCLQKTSSVVSGMLDPLMMTEFMLTLLKGAEQRDYMQSRQSVRMAIKTGNLSLLGLIDIVSNIIGMWPLNVSDLEETGR